jgi:tRNA(His) 5'-end guanylyltransferase
VFISSIEKKELQDAIKYLRGIAIDTTNEVLYLKARVKVLEASSSKPTKVKKPLTAAQRAKQRGYQKAYNERQKAKKLAEKGNTNVSA